MLGRIDRRGQSLAHGPLELGLERARDDLILFGFVRPASCQPRCETSYPPVYLPITEPVSYLCR